MKALLCSILAILAASPVCAQSYSAGNFPRPFVVTDINHDGALDVVVPAENDNAVSVLLGNSDGSFRAPHQFPTGQQPFYVDVADLNRDGKLDVVVANANSNTLSVFRGDGNGNMFPVRDVPTGIVPYCLTIGDWNHDGIPDIAEVDHQDSTVSVMMGNGDATFQPRMIYSLEAIGGPEWIAKGDFNRDGNLDLAISMTATSVNAVYIMLGRPDGTFAPPISNPINIWGPYAIRVADFNRDGIPDLAITGRFSNEAEILLGRGDGTFIKGQTFEMPAIPDDIAIGDFNRDGKLDLAIVTAYHTAQDSSVGTYTIMLGRGDGTFQVGTPILDPNCLHGVAVADLTFDGILDLLIADSAQNTIQVFRGLGDGSFRQ